MSPLQGMVSPTQPQTTGTGRVSLERVLAAVHQASPEGRLFSISDPALVGGSVYALVGLRAAGDFFHRDIVTVSTSDARILTVWHYGQNKTAGDWIIWVMHPLHFGTLWGRWVKVLWATAGMSPAVLSITGVLMY
jgi:PepSY-associated TM region